MLACAVLLTAGAARGDDLSYRMNLRVKTFWKTAARMNRFVKQVETLVAKAEKRGVAFDVKEVKPETRRVAGREPASTVEVTLTVKKIAAAGAEELVRDFEQFTRNARRADVNMTLTLRARRE